MFGSHCQTRQLIMMGVRGVVIVILACVTMASSQPQDRVNFVENAPGQNYGAGNIVDPAFYQPSNPNLGSGPLLDPAFYQPSNPNYGTGQIVDPGFYQPSASNPGYPPHLYPPAANPGYPPHQYPPHQYPPHQYPSYQPISIGPAFVENPPAPHWSQTLYPSAVARDENK